MAEYSVNSITLSPDLSTLFLIDNGNAIPFSLNTKLGLVIGTLNGQLTVASALPDIIISPPDDDVSAPGDDPVDEPIDRPIQPIARIARRRILRLSTRKIQWTLLFIKDRSVVSIMGASDIDASIMGASDIDASLARPANPSTDLDEEIMMTEAAPSNAGCQLYSFLIDKKTINIKRAGDILIIAY